MTFIRHLLYFYIKTLHQIIILIYYINIILRLIRHLKIIKKIYINIFMDFVFFFLQKIPKIIQNL